MKYLNMFCAILFYLLINRIDFKYLPSRASKIRFAVAETVDKPNRRGRVKQIKNSYFTRRNNLNRKMLKK